MSSSDVLSAPGAGAVGEVIEAVEARDRGSRDAMLERMEGIETRDRVRNGQRGGDSGLVGLTTCAFCVGVSTAGVVAGDESGDFSLFKSEPLRSRFLPRTVFRSEPFLFRFVTSAIAPERGFSVSGPSLGLSVLRRNLERMLPDIERLCPDVSLRFLIFTSLEGSGVRASSSMAGKGVGLSASVASPFIVSMIEQVCRHDVCELTRSTAREGMQCWEET